MVEIQRFESPISFQKAAQFLLDHEAENNLPLGILNNVIHGEYRETEPYLALAVDGGRGITGVICTPPYPALFSYHDPLPPDAVLDCLLDDLQDALGEGLVGISANKTLALRIKQRWEAKTGRLAALKMAMRIYKLVRVTPVKGVPGQMRPLQPGDRGLAEEWYAGFQRNGLGEKPDPVQVKRQVLRYLEADPGQRGLMLWEIEGVPVSMAGYAGPTPNGIRVGAVYTPPEWRQRGYASALTAGLSQHLLDLGYQFCFLFTDLLNPTSNHIYQQIGYRPVCDVDRYQFA